MKVMCNQFLFYWIFEMICYAFWKISSQPRISIQTIVSHDPNKLHTFYIHLNNAGFIEAENGVVEMRFKADKNLEFMHELHSNNKDKESLVNHVVHRWEDDEIIMYVKLPEAGDYALNLFAKEVSCSFKIATTMICPPFYNT